MLDGDDSLDSLDTAASAPPVDLDKILPALPSATQPAPTVPTAPTFIRFAGLLDVLVEDAQRRHEAKRTGTPLGPVTGFKSLDTLLGDALAPGLHIVHGSPGVGKTAFALQVASTCQCPALYVTAEMRALELLRRHTSRITGTYLGRLKSGELTAQQVLSFATTAAAAAPQLALLDATVAPAPPAEILRTAELTRDYIKSQNPDGHLLIVVDSLHSWADSLDTGAEEYDRLNEALAKLREISARLDCPVLAIAERNRGSMKGGGQSAGAGTRKIEYGAETVIELDAPADATPDASGVINVTLRISKNRNGQAGKTLNMRFTGRTQSYVEGQN